MRGSVLSLYSSSHDLMRPHRIGVTAARDLIGTAVNTLEAGLARIPRILGVFRFRYPGVSAAGDVVRNELDVSGHQILKRLWRLLLVERIALNGFVECLQILMKSGFLGAKNAHVVHRQRDR